MLQYDPSGDNNRKTKEEGWVPGRSIKRPTRRKWKAPQNGRSSSKVAVRQRFALTARMWHLLSPGQIAMWADAIAEYQAKAPAGVVMPTNAFTLYMYVNLNRQACDQPIVLVPPMAVDVPTLTISDISLPGATEVDFTVQIDFTTPDWLIVVRMSSVVSPGVAPTKQDVQLLSGPDSIFVGDNARVWSPSSFFAATPKGGARNLAFSVVNRASGQLGILVLDSATREA